MNRQELDDVVAWLGLTEADDQIMLVIKLALKVREIEQRLDSHAPPA